MMKKIIVGCVLILAAVGLPRAASKKDYVPEEKTAIAIAEAILKPIYGEKTIMDEEPFRGGLNDGIWTVAGTLNCRDSKGTVTSSCRGGVAEVRLSREDGRILNVT